jgi:imidazolonepropionase-like amidohydrolase
VELQHLVAAGLTPLEALQTATVNPAQWLQRVGVHGCVRPGCNADLVLLHANPLQDIAALNTIEGVIVNGEWMNTNSFNAQ